MLKELKRDRYSIYYTDGDIIFKIYNWDSSLTVNDIEKGLREAKMLIPFNTKLNIHKKKKNSNVPTNNIQNQIKITTRIKTFKYEFVGIRSIC